MEILHVSASASHSQSQVSSHVPRGTGQLIPQCTTSILGKRRRLGDYSYHNVRLAEDSSSELNSIVWGEDSVESDADQDTARDELVPEHLLDRIREDQLLLSQIHGDRSPLSHSTTSTSVDSGNGGNYNNLNRSPNAKGAGDGDKRDFLSTVSGLLEVSAVATTQDRYVRLAAAAASFMPCRRHFLHSFHVDVRGFELQAEESSGYYDGSEKADNQICEGEPERKRLGGVGPVKEHIVLEPMSARSSRSEISPKMDYTDLIRTLHSDSTIPDSCPGSVGGHEDVHQEDTVDAVVLCKFASSRVDQHDASSSNQIRRGPVSSTATGEPEISPLGNKELVRHDIDLSESFRFWNPPPKGSSLALAGKQSDAPPSPPPLTHHQSHPQYLSPSSLAPPQTPVQTCRSLSQQSSFTSPDRIPTRMPLFSATLSLAQMLGKERAHAVYYPPDSSSTDNGSDGSEDHNLRSSAAAFLSSRSEQKCSPRAKIKVVTKTLKSQMHIAFKKKDYYTPRARCVRFLPDEPDGCIDGSRKPGSVNQWPPEKLERGYWRVDVSTWPTNEKMKFWDNITQAIRAGRVGWIGAVVEGSNENGNGEIVRVYCFGGAVVHIWVFLFAMSDRRTVTNVQWIDGVGRTVIEVGEEVPTETAETEV
ncbi:hypothetical protein V1517DRAFT_323242 [Lipomyces orientalis]|uniref:Uncharacterized protein n=1 Tax=Lipomyces orientalis TaxID=1233043 RepID=A0ACC3TMS6_9ASCO